MAEVINHHPELIDLYQEAFALPPEDKAVHMSEVNDLVIETLGDEQIADELRRMAFIAFKDAKAAYSSPRKPESLVATITTVDMSRIGWAKENGPTEVSIEKIGQVSRGTKDDTKKDLFLANLTSLSRATEDALEKLKKQTDASGDVVADKLLHTVKTTIAPTLYNGVISGSNLRTVNAGKDSASKQRFADTSFAAYKEDAQGTSNRAVLLFLENNPNRAVIGLAALFDHEDDQAVYRALSD